MNQNKYPCMRFHFEFNEHMNKIATPYMDEGVNVKDYIDRLVRRHTKLYGVKYHRNMFLRLSYRHWIKMD